MEQRDPDFITLAEAAVILGCSTRTVQRLQADGELGTSRVRGAVYYRRSDVDAYLTASYRKPQRKGKAAS